MGKHLDGRKQISLQHIDSTAQAALALSKSFAVNQWKHLWPLCHPPHPAQSSPLAQPQAMRNN